MSPPTHDLLCNTVIHLNCFRANIKTILGKNLKHFLWMDAQASCKLSYIHKKTLDTSH